MLAYYQKNWYNTFPFSMERSSGPIMCISSVDWSFCKTHSEENTEMDVKRPLLWPCQHMILQSLQTWAPRTQSTAVCLTEAALSDETIGLRSSAQGQVDLLWRVKWLFCAWDERSGSVVFRQEVEPLADGLRLLRGPWVKHPTLKTHPSYDRTIWPLLYPQSGFSLCISVVDRQLWW